MVRVPNLDNILPSRLSAERLRKNELYSKLTIPIGDTFPDIKDAQLYIHKEGLIVNAEGWYHPEGKLIGEVMYAPDGRGDRIIFGENYRKLTLFPGTHTPVPYAQRGQLLREYDSRLDQKGGNPFFAKYKQIFNRDEFSAYISGEAVFRHLLPHLILEKNEIVEDIDSISEILGIDLGGIDLGFTGAPSFGNLDSLHDLDLIFSGTLDENIAIAKAMRDIVRDQPNRRLIEGGKGWNIRFFNDRRTLICSFFAYKNPNEAPLRSFEMEVLSPKVIVEGEVSDDLHSIYTPSILGLDNVRICQYSGQDISANADHSIQLIAYHTATRGECFEGDKIRARGALVRITTPTEQYLGVCVIEREGIRNLTPTWRNFYSENEQGS